MAAARRPGRPPAPPPAEPADAAPPPVPLSRAEAAFLYDLLTDYLAVTGGTGDPAAASVLAKLEAVVGEGEGEGEA